DRVAAAGSAEPPSTRPPCPALGGFAHRLDLALLREPAEATLLELLDLARLQLKPAGGLTERGGLVPVDPVPKLDHLPLVDGQALNRLAKGPIAQAQGNLLRGTAALVLDELAQRCSV